MPFQQDLNKIIITDKGVELSKDIKKELLSSPRDSQQDEYYRNNRRSLSPSNLNLPPGYQSQLLSQRSINLMVKPFKTQFMTNIQASSSPPQPQSLVFGTTDNLASSLYQPIQPKDFQIKTLGKTKNSDSWARSTFTSQSTVKSGFGSSTFYAVNNRKQLASMINVKSLGGLKINLKNYNYTNELQNQNVHQKLQMQQVQQERLSKKFSKWNDQYAKSSEMMKNKYYQKYEEIGKLGDKEDEDNFWKQWRTVCRSCDERIVEAEQEQQRYEESILNKLNKKYKESFKTLPNCAKIVKPKSLTKIPNIEIKPKIIK